MTTLTTDIAALLAACRAHPDEDTPRMALADALEGLETASKPCPRCEDSREPGWIHRHGKHGPGYYACEGCADIENGDKRGTGFVTDISNRDRAKFIRVQCELTKLSPKHRELFVTDGEGKRLEGLGVALTPRGDGHFSASDAGRGLSIDSFTPGERVDVYAHLARKDRHLWMRGLKFVRRVEDRNELIFRKDEQSGPWAGAELKERESVLLAAHPDWLAPCPVCHARRKQADTGRAGLPATCATCKGTGHIGHFARGLLVVPVPTLATVFEQISAHETRYSDSSLYDEVCVHCGATDARGGGLDRPCRPRWQLAPWSRTLREQYPFVAEVVPVAGAIHPREYGGGDDRWVVYRANLPPVAWDILCPGSHSEDVFVESHDQNALNRALAVAVARAIYDGGMS